MLLLIIVTINSVDSGVDMQSRPVSTYTNLSGDVGGLSTPRDSLIFQQPSDEGLSVNEDVGNVLRYSYLLNILTDLKIILLMISSMFYRCTE